MERVKEYLMQNRDDAQHKRIPPKHKMSLADLESHADCLWDMFFQTLKPDFNRYAQMLNRFERTFG